MEPRDPLQDVGRGIAQLHMRLGQLTEAVGRIGSAAPPADDAPLRDALLDLVDAVDEALVRRGPSDTPAVAPKRGFLARFFGAPATDGAAAQSDLWHGLALASARAHDALAAAGIVPVPTDGPFDPTVQRAVEREGTAAVTQQGDGAAATRDVVARTHRRGWMQTRAGARHVLRTALVSVRRG